MKWNNYTEVYDLFINSSRVKRIWGKKHALRVAESQTGNLFGEQHVELVNIYTGEIIYHN